ncbi:MAG: multicomponent K+:H+ antiporter subunit A [Pseudoalteromonas tetraodonis]|jgi:multicomponent K+:H+ antiporter subunit A
MDLSSYALPIAVLLPFFGALLISASTRFHRAAPAWCAALTAFSALLVLIPAMSGVLAGDTLIQSWEWVPSVGLAFAFRLDGLSLLFTLMILVIGLLVILYAGYYLSAKDSKPRFFSSLLLFMGAMLGVVLSENLLLLLVFWELTALSSFLLISFWQHREDARHGARMALAVTGMGGLALLGGVLLLGQIVGSYNLTDVLAAGDKIRAHEWYLPTLILILIGVFTKSAQFPFHFWLPHAMAAPTPVSSYLHSATMVKAGIFLLARFFPVLSGTPEWFWIVGTAGMLTLLLGAVVALFQHDLKGLLAYSTISHLGLITLLFGLGTPLAAVAALFHIINHATFKASLFMVAGIIDHETGSRDMRKLNGLMKYMPHTSILAIIAASAMAGVPLLNGFLSKEMFFDQAVVASGASRWALAIPVLATLGATFSVAYSLRFIHDVFFNGEPVDLPRVPHAPPRYMRIPVDFLVIICLGVGMLPALTVGPLLASAAEATIQGKTPYYSLAIWHGFNIPLLMSFLALLGGITVYVFRRRLFDWNERYLVYLDARIIYNAVLQGLIGLATAVTRRFDKGSLQNTLAWTLGAAGLVAVAGFLSTDAPLFGDRALMGFDPVALIAFGGLMLASLLTVVMHRQRMISLIMLGVVGLLVSLGFSKFSAPDLALTQLSVELVTVVLLMLALFFLPQYTTAVSSRWRRLRDAVWAVGLGSGAAVLTLAVLTRDLSPISGYFLENSVSGGGGTNVVNVILVDFRGFDTLGEIVVLSLAGLGVFGLLRKISLRASVTDLEGRSWNTDAHPLILQNLSRLLFPLMLLFAAFIFLRGHNLPGGGFIAGLVAALAIVLQYLGNGIEWTSARIRTDMHRVIAAGLFFAVGTGLVSILLGFPFLTSAFTYLNWPVVGKFEVASAMIFDLGVFLVVVGATVMILVELGKFNLLQATPYNRPKGDG